MRLPAAPILSILVLLLSASPARATQPPCPPPDGTYCPFGGVGNGMALSSACVDSSCATRYLKLLVQGWIPNF